MQEEEEKVVDDEYYLLQAYPIFNADCAIDGVLEISRVITKEKNMERQLLQADKLASLGQAEAQEATVIASVAGEGPLRSLVTRRPFRAPHHTASYAALVGGGPRLAPGEVTRAHHGIC